MPSKDYVSVCCSRKYILTAANMFIAVEENNKTIGEFNLYRRNIFNTFLHNQTTMGLRNQINH
jgi:hypothetical protein